MTDLEDVAVNNEVVHTEALGEQGIRELEVEEAAAGTEEDGAGDGSYGEDVETCYASAVRALQVLERDCTSGQRTENNKLLDTLAEEEERMFSEVPDFVAQRIAAENARKERRPQTARNPDFFPNPEHAMPRHFAVASRAYVNPRVPLPLPFSHARYKEQHPERQQAGGTYHALFFGDPSEYHFDPPADNRRRQIEEAKRAVPRIPKREPPCYDPPPPRRVVVSANFVPACARPSYRQDSVGNTDVA